MDIQEDRGQEQTDSRYSPASPDHLPVPYSQRSSLVPLAPVSPAHGSLQPLESSGESPVFSCSWASCLALLPWIHLSVVQSVGTEGARPQISVAATVTAGLSMSVCLAWLRIMLHHSFFLWPKGWEFGSRHADVCIRGEFESPA